MILLQMKAILSELLQWTVSERLLAFASLDNPLPVFFGEEAGFFKGVTADRSKEEDRSRATFSVFFFVPLPMA